MSTYDFCKLYDDYRGSGILGDGPALVAFEQGGVQIAQVSNGKRLVPLIKDFGSATDAIDGSNPAWQSR